MGKEEGEEGGRMSRHGGAWKKEKQGKRDERGSLLGGVVPPLALHRAGPVTAHAAAAWIHRFIVRFPWPWHVCLGVLRAF